MKTSQFVTAIFTAIWLGFSLGGVSVHLSRGGKRKGVIFVLLAINVCIFAAAIHSALMSIEG